MITESTFGFVPIINYLHRLQQNQLRLQEMTHMPTLMNLNQKKVIFKACISFAWLCNKIGVVIKIVWYYNAFIKKQSTVYLTGE